MARQGAGLPLVVMEASDVRIVEPILGGLSPVEIGAHPVRVAERVTKTTCEWRTDMMTDDIDMRSATFHGPINPATYTPTIDLTGVEFSSKWSGASGLRPIFSRPAMNSRWPDVTVWTPAGYIQWTLWAGFQIDGQWQLGAFLEMWSDRHGVAREWTGAHPLERTTDNSTNNWQGNWAYDARRWGALAGYVPKADDRMALMMTAGSTRPGSSNHPTVPERSNILVVPLRLNGIEAASEPVTPPPAPELIPAPQPPPDEPDTPPAPVLPPLDLSPLLGMLERIAAASEAGAASQRRTEAAIVALVKLLT